MKKEIWVDIKGYEGYYQVSNKGNVRSLDRQTIDKNGVKRNLKGVLLKKSYTSNGYKQVTLWKNHKSKIERVHRLVLKSFKGIDPVRKDCNHINGVKDDNNLENLEWVSKSENMQHAHDNNLIKQSKNLTEEKIQEIKDKHNKENYSYKELCDIYNLSRYDIWDIMVRS